MRIGAGGRVGPRWVKGGGKSGPRRYLRRASHPILYWITAFPLLFTFFLCPYISTHQVSCRSSRCHPLDPFPASFPDRISEVSPIGNACGCPDRGILFEGMWEPMRTATTGLVGPGREEGDERASGGSPLGAPAPRGGGGVCGLPGVPRPRAEADPRGDAEAPRQDARATSSRSSGGRPGGTGGGGPAPGTTTCKPSATRSPRRRRRSGSGAGSRRWRRAGRLCRTLRARLEQMLAIPPEAAGRAPPEPAEETQEAIPDAVATPEAAKATAGAGRRGGTT